MIGIPYLDGFCMEKDMCNPDPGGGISGGAVLTFGGGGNSGGGGRWVGGAPGGKNGGGGFIKFVSTSEGDCSETTWILLSLAPRRLPSTRVIVVVCPMTSIVPDSFLLGGGTPLLKTVVGEVNSCFMVCSTVSFSEFPVLPCCTVILFVVEDTGSASSPILNLFCFSQ